MAGATRLIIGASDATIDGGIYFPNKFFITAGAFTLGQILNFGSLAYITDYHGELHLLNGDTPVDCVFLVLPLLLGSLRIDLKALAHQACHRSTIDRA